MQLGRSSPSFSVYYRRLWTIAKALPYTPDARRFVIGVLVAFLPAAFIGAALHGFIKDVLFNPWIVCMTLIAGGFVLLVVDALPLKVRETDATRFPAAHVRQDRLRASASPWCPGVSRSGATIVGAC